MPDPVLPHRIPRVTRPLNESFDAGAGHWEPLPTDPTRVRRAADGRITAVRVGPGDGTWISITAHNVKRDGSGAVTDVWVTDRRAANSQLTVQASNLGLGFALDHLGGDTGLGRVLISADAGTNPAHGAFRSHAEVSLVNRHGETQNVYSTFGTRLRHRPGSTSVQVGGRIGAGGIPGLLGEADLGVFWDSRHDVTVEARLMGNRNLLDARVPGTNLRVPILPAQVRLSWTPNEETHAEAAWRVATFRERIHLDAAVVHNETRDLPSYTQVGPRLTMPAFRGAQLQVSAGPQRVDGRTSGFVTIGLTTSFRGFGGGGR